MVDFSRFAYTAIYTLLIQSYDLTMLRRYDVTKWNKRTITPANKDMNTLLTAQASNNCKPGTETAKTRQFS